MCLPKEDFSSHKTLCACVYTHRFYYTFEDQMSSQAYQDLTNLGFVRVFVLHFLFKLKEKKTISFLIVTEVMVKVGFR